jgi:hypothetical protein
MPVNRSDNINRTMLINNSNYMFSYAILQYEEL